MRVIIAELDPQLNQALAGLIGTMSTVLLLYGTSHWGPQARQDRKNRRKKMQEEDEDSS